MLITLSFLCSCGVLDALLPSAGTYKVNVLVNGLSIDEQSFVSSKDKIRPFFENSVSDDPDITGLMVFFKNPKGEISEGKVIYSLHKKNNSDQNPSSNVSPVESQKDEPGDDWTVSFGYPDSSAENPENDPGDDWTELFGFPNSLESQENKPDDELHEDEDVYDIAENTDEDEVPDDFFGIVLDNDSGKIFDEQPTKPDYYRNGDETIIPVKNLDDDLPFLPIPEDLPMGQYTMVLQVLSGKEILHKTEKTFFWLADVDFSLKGIQVHLPGIAADSQLIPKGMTIMLEAKLDFDSRLEPYVVWYNGKKIIGGGSYSEGGWKLLWKTPDQNGFLPLRAEVFPVMNRQGLAGYSQEISLPVSSKAPYLHLLSKDTPELLHWYLFDGNLNDSRMPVITERAMVSTEKKAPNWMPAGGTYGLVTGSGDAYSLPRASLSVDGTDSRQLFFRFKPVKEGGIFTVQFGPFYDVMLNLGTEGENLVLTLASPVKTVSETYGPLEQNAFITIGVDFSIWPGWLAAQLNIMGISDDQNEPASKPITLAAELDGEFRVVLGSYRKINAPTTEAARTAETRNVRPTFTALWDELALLYMPPMEVEFEEEEPEDEEEQPEPASEPVNP